MGKASTGAAILIGAAILAGCFGTQDASIVSGEIAGEEASTPGNADILIACRLFLSGGESASVGNCTFATPSSVLVHPVDEYGAANATVPVNTSVTVTGSAPGHEDRTVPVLADRPKTVHLTLRSLQGPTDAPAARPPGEPPTAPAGVSWSDPVNVLRLQGYFEPQVLAQTPHVAYVLPINRIYRTSDGGENWADVSPGLPEALPPYATDTSASLTDDGSLWFARTIGLAGGTIVCRSLDGGGTWNCNNLAMPGVTDRMWVAGLSADRAFVMADFGLTRHVWMQTTDGGRSFVPHAVTQQLVDGQTSQLVYEPSAGALFQVVTDVRELYWREISLDPGIVNYVRLELPAPPGLPSLAVVDGVFWLVTAETSDRTGATQVVLARSTDGGATWEKLPIASAAKSTTFAAVAASPSGRVAVVYYGSDVARAPDENGGTWSVYVAETSEGLSDSPIWIETQIASGIHKGSICHGSGCAPEDDPRARFSGDLIGVSIDSEDLIHATYNDRSDGDPPYNYYTRQVP